MPKEGTDMKLSTTLAVLAAAAGTAHAAALTIYKQPGFSGQSLGVQRDTPDLTASGFVDQASSVVVHSGRWQLCSQPDFGGDCAVLQPGRYARLDATLNHRVESVRPLGRADDRGEPHDDRGERNAARNERSSEWMGERRDERRAPDERYDRPGYSEGYSPSYSGSPGYGR
jgi:beta/gamma crystallin